MRDRLHLVWSGVSEDIRQLQLQIPAIKVLLRRIRNDQGTVQNR